MSDALLPMRCPYCDGELTVDRNEPLVECFRCLAMWTCEGPAYGARKPPWDAGYMSSVDVARVDPGSSPGPATG